MLIGERALNVNIIVRKVSLSDSLSAFPQGAKRQRRISRRPCRRRASGQAFPAVRLGKPRERVGLSSETMRDLLFELCAESLEAARAGESGGADRIELCACLSIGGVTPGLELLRATIAALSIPVHVLIRPRGGDFVYTCEEFSQMRRQIEICKQEGVSGVVFGVLRADGCVDVERSRVVVEEARPMKTVFHRAFDETRDLDEALEAVIRIGADVLLTSGGAPDVERGAEAIGRLRKQAGDRLQVMAGGGLTLTNLERVVRRSGVRSLHGTLGGGKEDGEPPRGGVDGALLEANVREAIRLFQRALDVR